MPIGTVRKSRVNLDDKFTLYRTARALQDDKVKNPNMTLGVVIWTMLTNRLRKTTAKPGADVKLASNDEGKSSFKAFQTQYGDSHVLIPAVDAVIENGVEVSPALPAGPASAVDEWGNVRVYSETHNKGKADEYTEEFVMFDGKRQPVPANATEVKNYPNLTGAEVSTGRKRSDISKAAETSKEESQKLLASLAGNVDDILAGL